MSDFSRVAHKAAVITMKDDGDGASVSGGADDVLLRCRALVMVVDEQMSLWRPYKGGGGDALSTVTISRQKTNDSYHIRAVRVSDQLTLIHSVIQTDLEYHRANPLFHHWSAAGRRYGLSFPTLSQANKFEARVQAVVTDITAHLKRLQTGQVTSSAQSCSPSDDEDDDQVFLQADRPSSPSTIGLSSISCMSATEDESPSHAQPRSGEYEESCPPPRRPQKPASLLENRSLSSTDNSDDPSPSLPPRTAGVPKTRVSRDLLPSKPAALRGAALTTQHKVTSSSLRSAAAGGHTNSRPHAQAADEYRDLWNAGGYGAVSHPPPTIPREYGDYRKDVYSNSTAQRHVLTSRPSEESSLSDTDSETMKKSTTASHDPQLPTRVRRSRRCLSWLLCGCCCLDDSRTVSLVCRDCHQTYVKKDNKRGSCTASSRHPASDVLVGGCVALSTCRQRHNDKRYRHRPLISLSSASVPLTTTSASSGRVRTSATPTTTTTTTSSSAASSALA